MSLAALLAHLSLLALVCESPLRLRMFAAYLFGTRAMPLSELWPILTQGDRDWIMTEILRRADGPPISARLPGWLDVPVMYY